MSVTHWLRGSCTQEQAVCSILPEDCCPRVTWIIIYQGYGSVPPVINKISVAQLLSAPSDASTLDKCLQYWGTCREQAEKTSQYKWWAAKLSLGSYTFLFLSLPPKAAILAPLDLWFTWVRWHFVNKTLREKLNCGSTFNTTRWERADIVSLFALVSPLIFSCFDVDDAV